MDNLNDIESKSLLENKKLQAEIIKIKEETRIITRWYNQSIFKVIIGGCVAGGLFTAWFLGYYQPFFAVEQQKINAQNQLNLIKHEIIKVKNDQVTEENKKLGKQLIIKEKILSKQVEKMNSLVDEYQRLNKKYKNASQSIKKTDAYTELKNKTQKLFDEQVRINLVGTNWFLKSPSKLNLVGFAFKKKSELFYVICKIKDKKIIQINRGPIGSWIVKDSLIILKIPYNNHLFKAKIYKTNFETMRGKVRSSENKVLEWEASMIKISIWNYAANILTKQLNFMNS